ncbi:MAG: VWA domain-containing protein [Bacteroidales bacterium]|nr:VWA domain-containing protein [Bacteroidales bacterium]
MNLLFSISSDISLWFLLLIIPAAIYIVYLFYRNDTSLSEMPPLLKKTAKVLRMLILIFIAILILSPFIRWYKTEIKKPLIVIAIDQSQSISIHQNFHTQRKQIHNFIQSISQIFPEKFNIKILSFGTLVRPFDTLQFIDKRTNISEIIQYVQSQYEFDNLSALILFSDGNFNSGINPLYLSKPISFPIYSILLGDTTIKKDIYIDKILYNPNQFAGINIKIQVQVKAFLLAGNQASIKLLKNKEIIEQKQLNITSSNYFSTITFTDYAEKSGTYTYEVQIDTLPGELLRDNNKKTAIVHVSNQKQNIAIVTTFPHPDVGALFTALETNPAWKIQILNPEKALDSIDIWNAIILYQLPTFQHNASQLFKKISEKQIPVLNIIGSQTQLNLLSTWFPYTLISQSKSGQFEDAFVHWDNTDNILNITQDIKETFEQFPPLLVPFGDYKIPENSQIVLFQKIKQIKTTKPIVVTSEWQSGNKCILLYGEGIFRWRMSEYYLKQQHTYFTTFFNKLMLYLISKQRKERFIVLHKPIYNEGENILIEAELYNKMYEPISDAEISFSIRSKERSDQYSFYFEKNRPFYILNIRSLPSGEYVWMAQTKYGGEQFSRKGTFLIQPHNVELQDYVSNHNLLKQLSLRTNGKVIPIDSLQFLPLIIEQNPTIVPVSDVEETFTSLINLNWLLLPLVILLAIEWFLRRFFGSI